MQVIVEVEESARDQPIKQSNRIWDDLQDLHEMPDFKRPLDLPV